MLLGFTSSSFPSTTRLKPSIRFLQCGGGIKTWCYFFIFSPLNCKNKTSIGNQIRVKSEVNLYTSIYTVGIYSINTLTQTFGACMLSQKPYIHLYFCRKKKKITLNIALYIVSILSDMGHASFYIKI